MPSTHYLEHASCASVTGFTLLAVQVEPARCSHYTALCYNSYLPVCLQLGDEVTSTSKLATHVCNMADTYPRTQRTVYCVGNTPDFT